MSIFADSAPNTPADGGFLPRKSVFADSVPSTPVDGFLPKMSISIDSVPSTPADGFCQETTFSQIRSQAHPFSAQANLRTSVVKGQKNAASTSQGLIVSILQSGFQPQERLSRFDSIHGSGDFDAHDGGSFQQRETFSRFDSMRSTKDFDYGPRFSSFDDSDPFGSVPFKSSFGSETPQRYSNAFEYSGPFRSSLGSETPRLEVGPFRSTITTSETPRADSDPFGSVGPFRSSLSSETPRGEADPFGSVSPVRSTLGSETPRRESDYFAQCSSRLLGPRHQEASLMVLGSVGHLGHHCEVKLQGETLIHLVLPGHSPKPQNMGLIIGVHSRL